MAMVEMALVLPVLLMVLFAIGWFGAFFQRWLTLSNAVREGARTGIAWRKNCVPGTVEDQIRTAVKNYAAAGELDLEDGEITITNACVAGSNLTVSVNRSFAAPIPYAVLPPLQLAYSSTMRNE
jgi:Flp pilus assembly protein TadG